MPLFKREGGDAVRDLTVGREARAGRYSTQPSCVTGRVDEGAGTFWQRLALHQFTEPRVGARTSSVFLPCPMLCTVSDCFSGSALRNGAVLVFHDAHDRQHGQLCGLGSHFIELS